MKDILNKKCDKCEKEINVKEDEHAECDKCGAVLCNDSMDCIRDHMEYTHGCGWSNKFPAIEIRLALEAKENDEYIAKNKGKIQYCDGCDFYAPYGHSFCKFKKQDVPIEMYEQGELPHWCPFK